MNIISVIPLSLYKVYIHFYRMSIIQYYTKLTFKKRTSSSNSGSMSHFLAKLSTKVLDISPGGLAYVSRTKKAGHLSAHFPDRALPLSPYLVLTFINNFKYFVSQCIVIIKEIPGERLNIR